MSKTYKILTTIRVIFLFIILSAAIQTGSGPAGRNSGIIGIIVMFGLISGIMDIWKTLNPISNDVNTYLNKY
jgi:hypothetical protein